MNKTYTRNFKQSAMLGAAAFIAMAFGPIAKAFEVQPLSDLRAAVSSGRVDLSWDWENNPQQISSWGFEGDWLPDGWSQIITNQVVDDEGNPVDPELGLLAGTWVDYILTGGSEDIPVIEGENCAVLLLADTPQDEWLIAKPQGANYLEFQNFLHPIALQWGADDEFPDHYYVMISRDNGESWEEIWDGRYDTHFEEGWHKMSLYLGDTDDNTLVAWRGVSSEEEGLYVLWMIDDVRFLKSAGSGIGDDLRPSEFRIYLDNALLGNVKSLEYTDITDKDPGLHTYKVVPYSATADKEYEGISTDVELEAPTFNPPTNVRVTSVYDEETDSYTVELSWEKPEGDREPIYYQAFANNLMFGFQLEEFNVGQSALAKGVYDFTVSAVYQYPDGESERVGERIALGTVFPPDAITLEDREEGNVISWIAPRNSPDGVVYNLYRGNKMLLESTPSMNHTDNEQAPGVYYYNVRAIYPDGEVSLPTSVSNGNEDYAEMSMPFEEDFTNGLLPANWMIECPQNNMKEMYYWRFDNWFDLPVESTEGYFDNEFASISSKNAGFNRLDCKLYTPWIRIEEGAVMTFSHILSSTTSWHTYTLEYTLDGENWDILEDLDEYTVDEPTKVEITLPEEFVGEKARFRWNYFDRLGGFAAVDKVSISNNVGIDDIAATNVSLILREGKITIKSEEPLLKAEIVSVNGMNVKSAEINGNTASLSITNLKGVYLVRVVTSKGTAILRKVVI